MLCLPIAASKDKLDVIRFVDCIHYYTLIVHASATSHTTSTHARTLAPPHPNTRHTQTHLCTHGSTRIQHRHPRTSRHDRRRRRTRPIYIPASHRVKIVQDGSAMLTRPRGSVHGGRADTRSSRFKGSIRYKRCPTRLFPVCFH